MVTWFCPECFEVVAESAARCPSCGAATADPRTYEEKLVSALRHPLPDRQLLAARILGLIRSQAAVGPLADAARQTQDPYLAAEAVRALARITTPKALAIVRSIARGGPVVARAAARSALQELE